MKNKPWIIGLAALAMAATGCSALNTSQPLALLGDPAAISAAERTIVIRPGTRHVNVTGGEIIRFDIGQQSFAWHFDGALNVTRLQLQQVAPAGVLDHPVIAYIRPNPFFIGGDIN